ncbi:MAG: hypothetical protein ABIK92_05025 [Pseudomonadota bacterium]
MSDLTIIKKPDAKIWKARIEIGQKLKKEKFDERAKRMREMFKGDHFPNAPEGEYIVINYCYAILKAILPQIYFQDPYLFLEAGDGETTPDSTSAAEAVLNHFWYTMKVKRQIKKIVLDALIYGFGLGKIGYNTDTAKIKLESGADYTEMIKAEYPFFKRTSPGSVVFDTDPNSIDDIKWLATNYFLPVDDVKKNYKNADDLVGDYYNVESSFVDKQKYGTAIQNDIKRQSIWEIQDLVSGKILTITEKADKFLKEIDNPYKLDGFNYKFLYLNEVPDEIYPLSDLEQIKDIVLEFDKTETQLLNHRSKAIRKVVSEIGIWATDEDKDNFFNNADMQNAEVKQNMLERIKVFDASTIDASLYNIQSELKDNLYKISATAENQLSSDSTTQKTATEINKIDANSQIRNSDRIDNVRDFVIDTAGALLKILQQFMSKKVSVKYKDGWEEFAKEDIKGNHNIRIEIGDMLKPNTDQDRARISQVLTETIEAVDEQGLPIVNRRELVKTYYVKYGFTKVDIEKLIPPPPPPPPPPPVPPPPPEPPIPQLSGNIPPEQLMQMLTAPGTVQPQEQMPPEMGQGI